MQRDVDFPPFEATSEQHDSPSIDDILTTKLLGDSIASPSSTSQKATSKTTKKEGRQRNGKNKNNLEQKKQNEETPTNRKTLQKFKFDDSEVSKHQSLEDLDKN